MLPAFIILSCTEVPRMRLTLISELPRATDSNIWPMARPNGTGTALPI